jgi:nucleoside-diphosphate-sugar epimerase
MSSTAGRNREHGRVLIMGGTGTLGRRVVARLCDRGRTVLHPT